MAEWFEDDSFWEAVYPVTFPPERFSLGEQEVEQVLRLVPLRTGHVLDLCCGPGRHAVPLASRGFTVTGVDRSAFLLDRARERAAAAGVAIEFVRDATRSGRLAGGALLVERTRVLDDWTRAQSQWILIQAGRAQTFEFTFTLYAGPELQALLREAGFGEVRLHGALDGRPYDVDAARLVAVARLEA